MGRFFKIGNQAILKDNISDVGIYMFEFPLKERLADSANKFAATMCALAGQDYIKYSMVQCKVLVVTVSDMTCNGERYIIHNSEELNNTIRLANERLSEHKFTRDGYYAATDFDRKLANFLNDFCDEKFVFTSKPIDTLFDEITE